MAFSDPFDVNVQSGGTGAVAQNIADQFIPEIWGQAVLEAFQQKIMMKNVGIDLSPEVANQGDKIHLPHIGVPALSAFTQGSEISADVTGSATSDETALTVSEYNVGSAYIPDIVKVQSNYDLMEIYAKQLAYACARGFDNFLHYQVANNLQGLLSSATGAGSTLSQANLTSLMGLILGETGDTEGWNLVLSPDMYASLNSLTSYSEGTQATLGADFGRTGNAGAILGMPVWIAQSPYMGSASGGADVSADATKGIKALYYAFSKEAKMQASYRHSYLSTLVTCESVYGGAVRNADADGERRIFALVDYEA
jgi:hypothetical protein